MRIIENKILPSKRFDAINLFGFIFIRSGTQLDERFKNHEAIHTHQMKYMLYVFFYLWYVIEWCVRLVQYRNALSAYFNISFEREAYENDSNFDYLKTRRPFRWIEYLRSKKETNR